jgi:hypothetical protein
MERQCLRQIIRETGQRIPIVPETEPTERLEAYLNKQIRLLDRGTRHGLPQSEILRVAQAFEDVVSPGERTTLLKGLEKVRHNVRRKVEDFTNKNLLEEKREGVTYVYQAQGDITVTTETYAGGKVMTGYEITLGDHNVISGDFVVAETIQNSFNRVAESTANDELKELLKQLHEAAVDMTSNLPEKEGREAARDLDAFAREVTSESPRKKWYELSSEGLISAAKTVGEVAAPVISTVTKILALLAVG